jgi:hypothetical protein
MKINFTSNVGIMCTFSVALWLVFNFRECVWILRQLVDIWKFFAVFINCYLFIPRNLRFARHCFGNTASGKWAETLSVPYLSSYNSTLYVWSELPTATLMQERLNGVLNILSEVWLTHPEFLTVCVTWRRQEEDVNKTEILKHFSVDDR